MQGEARKLHLIQAILKIDNDAVLTAIETIVDQDVNIDQGFKANFSDLLGVLSEEEAESMKKVIEENFERINPDDWK
jgi:phage terminase large subunit